MIMKFLKLTLAVLLASFLFSTSATAGPKIIRLAAVGDIMLGRQDDEAAAAFAELMPYLQDRQVVIGNLEGPLTDRGAPSKVPVEGVSYVFRTPPHYVERLKEAGFTIMSLANNHLNDYGPAGREQTIAVLEEAGLLHTGAPAQVARQKVGRHTVAVIGLAPNQGCQDINDIPAAAALVRQEAAKPKTLVVVVFHGGAEGPGSIYVPHGMETFLGERRGDLRLLGRELIDAGAHLVIGHGPHVPRGLEIYKDRLIAYSLGNFATGRGISSSGRNGLAPLLLVDITVKGELAGGRILSFRQNQPGQVSLDPDNEAVKLMHKLSLTDFELPGLDPDGRLVTSDSAALLMASTLPRPPRPQVVRAAAVRKAPAAPPAQTQLASSADPVPAPSKRQTRQPKSGGYEWDVYADLRTKL